MMHESALPGMYWRVCVHGRLIEIELLDEWLTSMTIPITLDQATAMRRSLDSCIALLNRVVEIDG